MRGVFLHVLADTLGSVGVIVSTFLIEHYNLRVADPICAFIISLLILMSVFPLVSHSSRVLVHQSPPEFRSRWRALQQAICEVDGVVGVAEPHLFVYASGRVVGSLRVGVKEGGEAVTRAAETLCVEAGLEHAIQVERAVESAEYEVVSGVLEHDHHDHCDHDHDHDDHDHDHYDHHNHDHYDHHDHDHYDHHHDDHHDHHHDHHDSDEHLESQSLQRRPASVPHSNRSSLQRDAKLLISRGKLD